jgi:hypothetical protein
MEQTEIQKIIDLCFKCQEFRDLENDHLRGGPEIEYSCSDETWEALEEADPTGRSQEKFITNQKEYDEHSDKSSEAMHQHVLTCQMDGCKQLREYRHNLKVDGY